MNKTRKTGGTVFATDLNDANPQFYYVWIMSPDGYVVQYTHLDPSTVKLQVNDTITEGQVLGNYGKFGNSTYSHLHVSFVEYDATTKKWNKYVHPGKYWPVKPDSFSGGSIGGGDDYDPTR